MGPPNNNGINRNTNSVSLLPCWKKLEGNKSSLEWDGGGQRDKDGCRATSQYVHIITCYPVCSLPLTVSDFNWPSSSTSTRSCPFSTILQQRSGYTLNAQPTRPAVSQREFWGANTVLWWFFCHWWTWWRWTQIGSCPPPLRILPRCWTMRMRRRRFLRPFLKMSWNLRETNSQKKTCVSAAPVITVQLCTYPDRTLRNSPESPRTQTGDPPSCSNSRPSDDCDRWNHGRGRRLWDERVSG